MLNLLNDKKYKYFTYLNKYIEAYFRTINIYLFLLFNLIVIKTCFCEIHLVSILLIFKLSIKCFKTFYFFISIKGRSHRTRFVFPIPLRYFSVIFVSKHALDWRVWPLRSHLASFAASCVWQRFKKSPLKLKQVQLLKDASPDLEVFPHFPSENVFCQNQPQECVKMQW